MAQVRSVCNGPLLTVRDHQMPMLRARGGHGRRERDGLRRAGNGYKLNWRVRPAHDDHSLVGKRHWRAAGKMPERTVRKKHDFTA
jgi:hypothetical protein